MTETEEYPDSGLGWGWCEASRTLTLYFENVNEKVGIKIVYSECENRMSNKDINACIRTIQSKGIEGIAVEPLNKETFEKLGYA